MENISISTSDEIWFELVLNGIGGNTIEQAKRNLSFIEFKQWAIYRQKRGSLHLGRRLEQNLSLTNLIISRALGNKKTKITDFAPHETEDKKEASDELLTWIKE